MILPALLLILSQDTLRLNLPIGTAVGLEISETWKSGEEEVVSFGKKVEAKVVAGTAEYPIALSGASLMTSWRIDGQEVKLPTSDPSPWCQRFKTDLRAELTGSELEYRLQRCSSLSLPIEPVEDAASWKWTAEAVDSSRIPRIDFSLRLSRILDGEISLNGTFREQGTEDALYGMTTALIDKTTGWILNQTTVVNNARLPGGDNQAVTYIYKLKTVKLTKPVK